jgi:hypothetical protein
MVTLTAKLADSLITSSICNLVWVYGVPGQIQYRKGSWVGVRLQGEKRVDEWQLSQCQVDAT